MLHAGIELIGVLHAVLKKSGILIELVLCGRSLGLIGEVMGRFRLKRWLICAEANLVVSLRILSVYHILLHRCLKDVVQLCLLVCGELLVDYIDAIHLGRERFVIVVDPTHRHGEIDQLVTVFGTDRRIRSVVGSCSRRF